MAWISAPERGERLPLQLRVHTAVCFGRRPAETLQSGLDRAGGDRGATRFELAESRRFEGE